MQEKVREIVIKSSFLHRQGRPDFEKRKSTGRSRDNEKAGTLWDPGSVQRILKAEKQTESHQTDARLCKAIGKKGYMSIDPQAQLTST